MSQKYKLGITAIIAALFVTFGAFGLGGVSADLDTGFGGSGDDVYSVDEHQIDPPGGSTVASEDCTDAEGAEQISSGEVVILRSATTTSTDDEMFLCVNTDLDGANDRTLTFDSDDVGKFDQPSCGNGPPGTNSDGDPTTAEWNDDACNNTSGSGTDNLTVQDEPTTEDDDENDLDVVIVRYTCGVTGARANITITYSDDDGDEDMFTFVVSCRGIPSAATLTAIPTVVEIVPADGSVSHSFLDLLVTDSSGGPVFPPDTEVVFTTDRCNIEEEAVDSPSDFNAARDIFLLYNNNKTAVNASAVESSFAATTAPDTATPKSDVSALFDVTITGATVVTSRAGAVLHCDPDHASGTGPGPAIITAVVTVPGAADLVATATVTVVGPPAFITVTASPTSLRCGEKSEITVRITDAIGQNVSDHTLVEMVTNLGGVLGGTGAVAGFGGPVVPISSTVSETFAGIARAFLLTSESHSGPYEVVVASGGGGSVAGSALGGIFSTPPVVAQVTVTCALPTPVVAAAATPTITAPRTGTGITPPNTGDAGLLDSNSSSSWALYALAGTALAFALAGLAATKASRR